MPDNDANAEESKAQLALVSQRLERACQAYRGMMGDIQELRNQQARNLSQHTDFAEEVTGRLLVRTILSYPGLQPCAF